TLRLADDALIIGHRLGEWCGHGPILEQDIALTNTALDHLGRARSLYQYAAAQFNQMPADEKKKYFSSVSLQNQVSTGAAIDEDDLAYLRDGWDFRNVLLVEQPNNDWAYTIARSFFYDVFNYFFFTELQKGKDETLAAIAEKSLKEITYHLRWSSEWVLRLGDGTAESHTRMQQAVDELWMYTGELFMMNDTDRSMLQQGICTDLVKIEPLWMERVRSVLREATINIPAEAWMQQGGKDGRHSEQLGHILTELQFVQRAYPGMEW
ncbi:MAG: 1,2-phenylacetyl-CoA epoxidase subunit PaaC, partial [Chitinophagales bacterium]